MKHVACMNFGGFPCMLHEMWNGLENGLTSGLKGTCLKMFFLAIEIFCVVNISGFAYINMIQALPLRHYLLVFLVWLIAAISNLCQVGFVVGPGTTLYLISWKGTGFYKCSLYYLVHSNLLTD